jgi:ribosomal protein L37AE/L43A
MKKENCPFCGHRWIRKSSESMIECPNCRTEYLIHPQHEETEDEEILEDEESLVDEFAEPKL